MKKAPFKLRSGNKPSIAKLSGVSPLKDEFVKIDESEGSGGKKKGTGPYTERQAMRSKGLKLIDGAMEMSKDKDLLNDNLANEMFDKGDALIEKARKGTFLDRVLNQATIGGEKLK